MGEFVRKWKHQLIILAMYVVFVLLIESHVFPIPTDTAKRISYLFLIPAIYFYVAEQKDDQS